MQPEHSWRSAALKRGRTPPGMHNAQDETPGTVSTARWMNSAILCLSENTENVL
jgi:hypothetical protein